MRGRVTITGQDRAELAEARAQQAVRPREPTYQMSASLPFLTNSVVEKYMAGSDQLPWLACGANPACKTGCWAISRCFARRSGVAWASVRSGGVRGACGALQNELSPRLARSLKCEGFYRGRGWRGEGKWRMISDAEGASPLCGRGGKKRAKTLGLAGCQAS